MCTLWMWEMDMVDGMFEELDQTSCLSVYTSDIITFIFQTPKSLAYKRYTTLYKCALMCYKISGLLEIHVK